MTFPRQYIKEMDRYAPLFQSLFLIPYIDQFIENKSHNDDDDDIIIITIISYVDNRHYSKKKNNRKYRPKGRQSRRFSIYYITCSMYNVYTLWSLFSIQI